MYKSTFKQYLDKQEENKIIYKNYYKNLFKFILHLKTYYIFKYQSYHDKMLYHYLQDHFLLYII